MDGLFDLLVQHNDLTEALAHIEASEARCPTIAGRRRLAVHNQRIVRELRALDERIALRDVSRVLVDA